jgi:hypothetical protein
MKAWQTQRSRVFDDEPPGGGKSQPVAVVDARVCMHMDVDATAAPGHKGVTRLYELVIIMPAGQ